MPSFEIILSAFITLFVTIDPIGLAPLFIAITTGMNKAERLGVALRSTFTAWITLIVFAFFGAIILKALGITLHAFRIAGGLLLFYIAFEMIFEKRQERQEETTKKAFTKEHLTSIAVFPIAFPLIAGPGAISALIILSDNMGHDLQGSLIMVGIITSVIILVLLSFLASGYLEKILGESIRMVLTRLLGVLLASLAVQFVADGAIALFS
ncbi:MAG: MarC family protein [Nitratireductor sp.]